jgi:hypothetical protein
MHLFLSDIFRLTIPLLVKFLEQNKGKLSKRAREKEFSNLTDKKITDIEENYKLIMSNI